VNYLPQNVKFDFIFLLGILLKYFQTSFANKRAKNIILFGSTNAPRKVDPALISPNRLNHLINIWMFSISQRQEEFLLLLHSKFFYLKNKKYYLNEFGYTTIGYNARDLVAFFNEFY
jgi:SpoVK/Ycf46/Vps4 family AAA+-type ATPase